MAEKDIKVAVLDLGSDSYQAVLAEKTIVESEGEGKDAGGSL